LESTYGRDGNRKKTQNMKVFDVPTPEELYRNLKVTEVNKRRGSGASVRSVGDK
jgi:hypothetical protein